MEVRALDDFTVFFKAEHGHLIAFLLKAGFTRGAAEDAASVTMTLAYRKWGNLTNPRAWIRTVAYRRAARDAVRERQHVSRLIEKGWDATDHDGTEPFEAFENRVTILRLLKELPKRQRLVMAWHLDGFGDDAIAAALGMRPDTVRSHRRHALARMRKAAQEGGEGPHGRQ